MTEQLQTKERALIAKDFDVEGTRLEVYGARAEVRELVTRLMSFHSAAREVGEPGMLAVAQLALMVGASPLPSTNEIHVWMNRGKVQVDLGINYFRRRARELGGVLWDYEPRIMTDREYHEYGVDPDTDIGAICRGCRTSDLQMLMSIGVPAELAFEEAMKRSARIGIGTVNRNAEPKKGRPLSWTALKAAEKDLSRALFPNLEQPSAEEREAILSAVPHVEPEDQDWDGETLNGTEAENLARMKQGWQEAQAAWDAMTPEEQSAKVADNSEILYGDPDFEGFDTPPEPPPQADEDEEPESEKAPVADALTPEVIRRVCRYKATWKKGQAADWSDAVRNLEAEPINEGTLKMVNAALNKAITGRTTKAKDEKRHEVYQYLFGISSGNKLTLKEGAAILAWIGLPDGGIGDIKALARAEVEGVLRAHQGEAGQIEMALEG